MWDGEEESVWVWDEKAARYNCEKITKENTEILKIGELYFALILLDGNWNWNFGDFFVFVLNYPVIYLGLLPVCKAD